MAAADTQAQGQPAFSSQPLPAVPGAPAPAAGGRPRVGLVLAGGGAKGGAHVGVLKVLEEMHVPVDCIAGTSMGALVGGGYASGINAKGMEEFLLGIDWPKVVGGVGQWEKQPIEQKRGGVTYSNQLDMGLKDGHVVMPPGLMNTSGIDDLLRSYVAQSRNVSNFDQLPIPYRAVATDMVSGQMVVLGDGDLATAMRASMAIPGAFAPVRLGDYILNDGGMVRNLPIDVARNLCADVVIAVNLVTEPIKPENLQTATQLAGTRDGRHAGGQREAAAADAEARRHTGERACRRHRHGRLHQGAGNRPARREGGPGRGGPAGPLRRARHPSSWPGASVSRKASRSTLAWPTSSSRASNGSIRHTWPR